MFCLVTCAAGDNASPSDLAMLEAELSSINGVRAGQKSRDKKGGTCAALKNNSRGEFNASETCAQMQIGPPR